MASRRKDMWRLLYNLVNRSDTSINDIFNFVDDILCKEPSLLRCYSARDILNQFQDTFIFWLINKLVKCLNEDNGQQNHEKNLQLQHKIITSCLVNHPKLFERLVTAYNEALEQLTLKLCELDTEEDNFVLELHIFKCDSKWMHEIDPNCTIPDISITVGVVDQRIQDFLSVLEHALTIGNSLHHEFFIASMLTTLRSLKECDCQTKLRCLRYCYNVARIQTSPAWSTYDKKLATYCAFSKRAMALMWESVSFWLSEKFLNMQELEELASVTSDWLGILTTHIKDINLATQEYFHLTFSMLLNIVDLNTASRSHLWQKLINSIYQLMQKQFEVSPIINIEDNQLRSLISISKNNVIIIRLMAVIYTKRQNERLAAKIIDHFQSRLEHLLGQQTHTDVEIEELCELLTAIKYLEHNACQQQQIEFLVEARSLSQFYTQTFENRTTFFSKATDWQALVYQYIEANSMKSDGNTKNCFKVYGLMLHVYSIRAVLDTQTQQRLVSQIEQHYWKALLACDQGNGFDPVDVQQSLQSLCVTYLELPASVYTMLQHFFAKATEKILKCSDESLRKLFCNYLPQLFTMGYIKVQHLKGFVTSISAMREKDYFAGVLCFLFCISDLNSIRAYQCFAYNDDTTISIFLKCALCGHEANHSSSSDLISFLLDRNATWLPWHKNLNKESAASLIKDLPNPVWLALLKHESFAMASAHLKHAEIDPEQCLEVVCYNEGELTINLAAYVELIPRFAAANEEFLPRLARTILKQIQTMLSKPLDQQKLNEQRQMLQLINCCSYPGISEIWLFHFFKMTFFFLVHSNSLVTQEAILSATQLCAKHKLIPITLWNWYKRDALNLVVQLALDLYLTKGVRLTRSLRAFSKMLGFSCVQEFICKYHRLLTTMILPYCIKQPRCKGAIVLMSKLTRKPIPALFIASFLRIYTHIYLTEEPEVGNKCIELIVNSTASSLQQLMNTDVKQTVSEILIYFNRNPTFVMRAFQCLLLQQGCQMEQDLNSQTSTTEFSKFIADRFLGVITYFENCLSEPNFEKPLKEEALYSMGQIIRFVGASHITQFRFKIIAMLSFVLSLNDIHLQRICLKIWNTFLHVVNIQELGPLLSRIVASLLPLLQHSEAEVNLLYEFVILKNASMLGPYISDLYFLERQSKVASSIRQSVARQTEILKGKKSTLEEKLNFLHKQITNENSQVRVYGLTYLADFIAENRIELNRVILNEMLPDTLIERTVNILIDGCQHEDCNLRLASAKCIGELGAIDASYMPSNYNLGQTTEFPLSILTDSFAKMALSELCHAYQFQKNTKYVDNFSLAIQETLAISGISPREKKKLNVWNSFSERMRQIMEPFLNSCYTGSRREVSFKAHPLFGSHNCNTYDDWAFHWASRLIDCLQTTETKHLLISYKPSIKRDSNMMASFFPYILLHAILECTEMQTKQIYEEFCTVFNQSCNFEGQQLLQQQHPDKSNKALMSMGLKEFHSKKYSADYRLPSGLLNSTVSQESEEMSYQIRTATKLCSEQIDFLQRWLRERQRINITTAGNHPQKPDKESNTVENFLSSLDKLLIARANHSSGESARALMYLEDYIEVQPKERLIEQFSLLIEIYGRLMDADSVEGAVQLHTYDLSISQEILVNRLIDRHQDMVVCYEKLLRSKEQFQPEHIRGMIDSYLRMDTPKTALLITDGLWQRMSDQFTDNYFKECKSELLWRLGSYEELKELFDDNAVRRNTSSWHVQCAGACLDFRQLQISTDEFSKRLDLIRTQVLEKMRTCSAIKQNSYAHSYDEVVKLHLLHEMEKCRNMLSKICEMLAGNIASNEELTLAEVRNFFADWNLRLEVIQPSVRVLEPIFGFRRSLLLESKRLFQQTRKDDSSMPTLLQELCGIIDDELGQLWINSAQINRDAGNLQRAQLSIMNATHYNPKTLFLEKAKLLWQKGDQMISLKLIEENLQTIEAKCEGETRMLSPEDGAIFGEAKYLQATYNAESMNICSELNLRYFKEAISGNRNSERCYVQLAHYLEKMYESFQDVQKDGADGRKLLQDIMVNYAKSMRCGTENVYQSLPRLISLWLDTTSRFVSMAEQSGRDSSNNCNLLGLQELTRKMNDILNNCSNILPTGIFYTAFSQLLSRICHPSPEVFNVLRTILIKLIDSYPHQSLWMLLPIYKSSFTNRIKRCRLIFTDARLAKPGFQKLLNDFNMLVERLIELTNKEVTFDRAFVMSDLVKQLPKLFRNSEFSEILLPFEKYMQPCFPISSTTSSFKHRLSSSTMVPNESSLPTNLFPHKQIYIRGFKEEITVLRSAAKPKKITIYCSDGNEYDVMVKPKDDLRKDFRLMEFNGLVKRYLHQDSQARSRRLRIRTYAVIPFNEECGLVEWLPKLNTFRGICNSFYRPRGLGIPDRMLRSYTVPTSESLDKKRAMYLEKLLPRYPPVFQEWFRQQFPTPHTWYEARSSYVKTVAVMSIVGYILGLGDRHGENILFDERTGEAVHVDFNCLFNQGESFAYPELVPFRLTNNMVRAMGPLGIEGPYRKCSEITLRLLKQESKTLMSVLRPFVYDLVVQNRNYAPKKSGAELTDPHATEDVRRIAERLQGYVKKHQINSMPLSPEGQVNFLIAEAINIDNLASMYIGWSAFI